MSKQTIHTNRKLKISDKIMFIQTQSLSNAFWQFTVYVCINIISELFRKVEKIKQFNFKLYSSNDLSSFCIILTKQLTLSVTRPFDTSPAHYYKRSIVTMHLSCTVVKIWRLKDNGVTNLTYWGHVTSSVLNITLISYIPLRYIRNVACEE